MADSRLIRSLYDWSPHLVQNLMASVFGMQKNYQRFSHPKWKYWEAFYRDVGTWSEQQLRDYQWKEFKATLEHAYETVPFYRDRYREIGICPQDIQSPDDVKQLPYTTKDDIRHHSERMISDLYSKKNLNRDPTSGSTGQPLMLYNDPEAVVRNYAIRWARCRPGLTRAMKSANFTGLEIVHPSRSKPPFWRTNYASNQQLYSVFHMTEETLPAYLENLNRFKPDWIYGYPSAIHTLAEFMMREGKTLDFPVRAIITSSEQCLPHYRSTIERVFGIKLLDEYGQAEFAGLAFECDNRKLHELMDYAYLEYIPTGKEEGEAEVRELICTSLINKSWPLIRYQVGDLAVIQRDSTCSCGQSGQIIERLHGRTAQFLWTRDGRKISNISVMAKKCRHLRACQAVQYVPGEMTLRIVREPEFAEDDAELAIREFRKKIGGEDKMAIKVQYADKPILTSAGKFLMIVSHVKTNPFSDGDDQTDSQMPDHKGQEIT